MIFDIQKASMWKRISAYIFDFILLGIVVVGMAFLLSTVTGYDDYSNRFDEISAKYEQDYGVDFNIAETEYAELTEEEKKVYLDAFDAFSSNEEASYLYSMMISLTLTIISISILIAYVLLEVVVPLIFKNGQTLGKKIFAVALMRTDGVKISTLSLVVRTILGKYTIETMVPVLIVIMIYFGALGLTGTIVLGLIALLQLIILAATKTRSAIHDLFACTVAVDFSSQLIFDSPEALLEYKKKIHEESIAHRER